nr:hypothetical protein Q903MT_gene3007 [Picea sitchensis]
MVDLPRTTGLLRCPRFVGSSFPASEHKCKNPICMGVLLTWCTYPPPSWAHGIETGNFEQLGLVLCAIGNEKITD